MQVFIKVRLLVFALEAAVDLGIPDGGFGRAHTIVYGGVHNLAHNGLLVELGARWASNIEIAGSSLIVKDLADWALLAFSCF